MNYHDRPELSSSQVEDFLDDPIKWYHVHVAKDWPKDDPTPQMKFGTAVHRMIELGGPEHIAVTIPADVLNGDGHCKGKAWLDWKSEQSEGVEFIKPGVFNPFDEIWGNIHTNDFAATCLDCDRKEYQIIWEHKPTGLKCRTLVDVLLPNIIVDWKAAADISPRDFQSAAYRMHYVERLAFYQLAVEAETGERLPVVCVAIKNKAGFGVQPYEIDSEWLEKAHAKLEKTMRQIAEFDLDDHCNQQIVTLAQPGWAKYESEYELELS